MKLNLKKLEQEQEIERQKQILDCFLEKKKQSVEDTKRTIWQNMFYYAFSTLIAYVFLFTLVFCLKTKSMKNLAFEALVFLDEGKTDKINYYLNQVTSSAKLFELKQNQQMNLSNKLFGFNLWESLSMETTKGSELLFYPETTASVFFSYLMNWDFKNATALLLVFVKRLLGFSEEGVAYAQVGRIQGILLTCGFIKILSILKLYRPLYILPFIMVNIWI